MFTGRAVFGIPISATIAADNGNKGMPAIGLPTGPAIGIAVDNKKNKKAFRKNRQLNAEGKNASFIKINIKLQTK
jgi:hypothetical protein